MEVTPKVAGVEEAVISCSLPKRLRGCSWQHVVAMVSYSVNDRAVKRARELIGARQYVLESEWGEVQPKADDENEFLVA